MPAVTLESVQQASLRMFFLLEEEEERKWREEGGGRMEGGSGEGCGVEDITVILMS